MTRLLTSRKIGDNEYFIRQLTINLGVRFPEQLTRRIVEVTGLKYADALGFRIVEERPDKIFVIEVIPLKLELQKVGE